MEDSDEFFDVGGDDFTYVKLGFFKEDPERFVQDLIRMNENSSPTRWDQMTTWMSRKKSELTAWWVSAGGASFGHVEIVFPDSGLVCSTTEKGGLHITEGRLLSNPNYTSFLDVKVPTRAAQRMEQYARSNVGLPFNVVGRFWNSVPLLTACLGPIDTRGQAYYCSELITTLLQMGGKCKGLDAKCTNPTQLYWYLKRTGEGIPSYNEAATRELGAPPDPDQLSAFLSAQQKYE